MFFRRKKSALEHFRERPVFSTLCLAGFLYFVCIAPPPAFDRLKVSEGTLAQCVVYKKDALTRNRILRWYPVITIQSLNNPGEYQYFQVSRGSVTQEKFCSMINPHIGKTVKFYHGHNPRHFFIALFRNTIWQMEAQGKAIFDYKSQVENYKSRGFFIGTFVLGALAVIFAIELLFLRKR